MSVFERNGVIDSQVFNIEENFKMIHKKIDNFSERRIKDSSSIVDVFKYYGFELTKKGVGFVTNCPFHDDKHPSMTVNPSRNICKCFSCGKKAMNPVGFIMEYEGIRYHEALLRLADIEGVVISGQGSTPPPPKPAPKPAPKLPPTFMSQDIVCRSMQYGNNPLYRFLSSLFGESATYQELVRYHVGTSNAKVNSKQGDRRSVIFWQTDEQGRIRGGKIIPYDETTGRRIHADKTERDVTWAHSVLHVKDYNLCQCLFGQHLIKSDTKRINIVESEKTAIIASLYFGDSKGIWAATGGKDKTASTDRIMEASVLLKGKLVVLYPDADGTEEWGELKNRLVGIGINAKTSTSMSRQPAGSKFDIADIIISSIQSRAAAHEQQPLPSSEQQPLPF